jgi:hypothetical protein
MAANAESRIADRPDVTPTPPDAHAAAGMGWVMPLWLICFLVTAAFGVVSYLFGWWFTKG